MPGSFFGRRLHYFIDEHRIFTDPLTNLQLTEHAAQHDLASCLWLSPANAARRGLSLRFLSPPVNLCAGCYGETFCLLPSKSAALRWCSHLSDAEDLAEQRRQAAAMQVRAGEPVQPQVFLLSALAAPLLSLSSSAGMYAYHASQHRPHSTERQAHDGFSSGMLPPPWSSAAVDAATSGSTPEERRWSLCPRDLESFFLSAAAAATNASSPSTTGPSSPPSPPPWAAHPTRMPSPPRRRTDPPRELFWLSAAILQAEHERAGAEQAVPVGKEGNEEDGGGAAAMPPTLPTSLHQVTTPCVYKTLVNTDQLLPCQPVSRLVFDEYHSFAEALGRKGDGSRPPPT